MTLINHPASDETLGRVASALETANTLTAAQLAGTSGAAIYDAFYAAGVTPENIDDMFVSWWHGADDGQYTKTQLLARWFNLLNSDKTFGTKFYNFGTSQTTQGELCDDSAEIGVTTPSTNTVKGKDPLHQQFAFWTVEVEYEIDANGEIEIKSVAKVDSSFNRGGTNGMVGVAQKTGWLSITNDSVNWWVRYRTAQAPGYVPIAEGVSPVDNNKSLTIPKPANWAWHFIGDLAYDKAHPEFTLPSIVDNGANSGNGFKSAVYVPASGGVYGWLSWSNLGGFSACGLACAGLYAGLGDASWNLAAGAPGSGANRGEWAG